MEYVWDDQKARVNLRKHGVDFADAVTALCDELALTLSDEYEEDMRKQYDFSKGKRGPVVKEPPGKTRITIRIDDDVLKWFRSRAHAAGGGNYQTAINAALRQFIGSSDETLEDTVRAVVREELARFGRRGRNRE